eukprot:4564322-Karenia_brevis.AAC.1
MLVPPSQLPCLWARWGAKDVRMLEPCKSTRASSPECDKDGIITCWRVTMPVVIYHVHQHSSLIWCQIT